ncbi:uncharacterized protein LOC122624226 [Drosophila teissieri]|uniref:uncharacterized protein LOC122624226 n=1 Tax=Drosophila teissieri TaxID=7243 RepID=UPI001CBA1525|nr:uncharacterized protein LOC122624226 [Drosophila teissieri]
MPPSGAAKDGKHPVATGKGKHTYAEKRSAGQILRSQERSKTAPSAEWMKKEAPKPPKPTEVKKRPPPKRERSQNVPSDPSAKQKRVQPGRSFAEIAKNRILLGVVDRNDPSDRIPRNKWKWVEAALAIKCFEILAKEPGPPPVCKDVEWFQGGVKVIACDDERSAELYKAAVKELGEVYEGAGLVALSWSDVPCRPRARIWIPASIEAPDLILTMLQRCNPHLPTSDWRW